MNIRASALIVVLLAAAPRVAADDDPLRSGVAQLETAVDALGEPAAGEVASEVDELQDVLAELKKRVRDLADARASLEAALQRHDRDVRELESRRAVRELDQTSIDNDYKDFERRFQAHQVDWRAHLAAVAAATTDDEKRRNNAWAAEGNRRGELLTAEQTRLGERIAALDRRRAALDAAFVQHALNAIPLQKQLSILDRELALALRECSAALSRALAVRQILDTPARTTGYRSPRALADAAAGTVFVSIGKELALKSMENHLTGAAVTGRVAMRALARLGLGATAPGIAFNVADIMLDYGHAAVDMRTEQVMKNVVLIGDYGEAMRRMIQTKGGAATQDPEYRAMRAELERLAADMPRDSASVLLQGLDEPAAVATALLGVAGNYVGSVVGRAGGKITNHLSDLDRATLGPGAVKFFGRKLEALSSAFGDEMTKISARAAGEAIGRVYEARSSDQ